MFEKKHQSLLPLHAFVFRIFLNLLLGIAIICISLLIGMIGYHYFEKLDWVDSFLNASMILSGMGQVTELKTEGGKIFAGCYALFSGVIFLVVIAVIMAPIFHRFMHNFLVKDNQKS